MTQKTPSSENKKLAKVIAQAFGGSPRVHEYIHDTEPLSIHILWSSDCPNKGITSYATIGLSDTTLRKDDGAEFPHNIEIVGALETEAERKYGNIIGSAAFRCIRTKRWVYPGAVLKGYVKEYYPTTSLPHLYFTAPFLWEENLKELDLGSKVVNFLMAMPIGQKECEYLEKQGDDKFETLMQEKEIDIFNINREECC